MSNLIEEKLYLEWLKNKLWSTTFSGKVNKGMTRQIDEITNRVAEINKYLSPREYRGIEKAMWGRSTND